ncbi:hypothetical protein Lal_00024289 [Lupinus albus]|nr:hypothetical protein Lal_00024289 [Lupinus albus]
MDNQSQYSHLPQKKRYTQDHHVKEKHPDTMDDHLAIPASREVTREKNKGAWMEVRAILEDDIDVDDYVELVVLEDIVEVSDLTSDSDDDIFAIVGASARAVAMANDDDTEEDPSEGSSAPSNKLLYIIIPQKRAEKM